MKKLLFYAVVGMSMAVLPACGGCGKDNNQTTQDMSPTDPDMSSDAGTDMTGCTAGDPGCACTMDNMCNGGAMCVDGMCMGAQSSGLNVLTDTARSCEILLKEQDGGRVLGATYASGVTGSMRRRAPNVAIAISLAEDVAFPSGTIQVQTPTGSMAPTVSKVNCFDSLGNTIDGAQVEFQ